MCTLSRNELCEPSKELPTEVAHVMKTGDICCVTVYKTDRNINSTLKQNDLNRLPSVKRKTMGLSVFVL
jgi:hypothetical protein